MSSDVNRIIQKVEMIKRREKEGKVVVEEAYVFVPYIVTGKIKPYSDRVWLHKISENPERYGLDAVDVPLVYRGPENMYMIDYLAESMNIGVGDIILINHDNIPRNRQNRHLGYFLPEKILEEGRIKKIGTVLEEGRNVSLGKYLLESSDSDPRDCVYFSPSIEGFHMDGVMAIVKDIDPSKVDSNWLNGKIKEVVKTKNGYLVIVGHDDESLKRDPNEVFVGRSEYDVEVMPDGDIGLTYKVVRSFFSESKYTAEIDKFRKEFIGLRRTRRVIIHDRYGITGNAYLVMSERKEKESGTTETRITPLRDFLCRYYKLPWQEYGKAEESDLLRTYLEIVKGNDERPKYPVIIISNEGWAPDRVYEDIKNSGFVPVELEKKRHSVWDDDFF